MNMVHCILFGAGLTGKRAWYKFNMENNSNGEGRSYNIFAYTDNDQKLWGTKIHGVPVIRPDELKNHKNMLIIICSDYYKEIAEQLDEMGIDHIAIVEPTGSMLYSYTKLDKMVPLQIHQETPARETVRENEKFHILFVQQIPCIRTHKIAAILKKNGIRVSLAYTSEHPAMKHSEFTSIYEAIYPIFSMSELIEFVNQSDFDLVHSSNEPDSLTNLLLLTNKKIVHDTHDMMSLCREINMDMLVAEYIANVKSHGNIYVNESNRQIALRKFPISKEKTIVFENRPLQTYRPQNYLHKLSDDDGELHCVYEGGISPDPNFHRYFEDIWMKIVSAGIHIHYYSTQQEAYCRELDKKHPNLHYEGCLGITDLITEMTQYDCGLLLLNVTVHNRIFLETSLANKVFEYLCANLPIAVNMRGENKDFIDRYGFGGYLDMEGNVKKQLNEIASIEIDPQIMDACDFTMDKRANELISFYRQIING